MIDWLANNAGMSGLMFFFIVFVAIAAWAYRPKAKDTMEAHKFIPIDGDER